VHDITIFHGGKARNSKIIQIPEGKRVIADSGLNKGEPKTIAVSRLEDTLEVRKLKGRAKSRQETFNSRLKVFKILSTPFRHRLSVNLEEHKTVFEAVCVACQYDLKNGHGLFEPKLVLLSTIRNQTLHSTTRTLTLNKFLLDLFVGGSIVLLLVKIVIILAANTEVFKKCIHVGLKAKALDIVRTLAAPDGKVALQTFLDCTAIGTNILAASNASTGVA
jgi:hypothetical protein